MTHEPRYDDSDLPRSERLTNDPFIPPSISRSRPPQLNQQVCDCHCHTGNGCHCSEAHADPTNSYSDGRGGGEGFSSDMNALRDRVMNMGLDEDSYDSDSDIELDSESSSSSAVPYQFYNLHSPENEGMAEVADHIYDFLHYVNDAFMPPRIVDDRPDNLDEPFAGPTGMFVASRRGSPAASMDVNCGSGEQSLRSSMRSSAAMIRSGTPSHFIRGVGYTFHDAAPPSRFLELTPPLSPS